MKIIKIASVASTNQYAEKLLNEKAVNSPTCVVTQHQTAGKGQDQNTWESEADKNLTFSIICFPSFLPASQQFELNKAVALVVSDLLKATLPQENIFIKWPNDIYIDDKKTAGILIQTSVQNQSMKWAIIGIGINVNQDVFPEYLPNPASVIHYKKTETSLGTLLEDFLIVFEKRFHQLKMEEAKQIDEDYLKVFYKLNQHAAFMVKGERIFATIRGVNQYGWLQLQYDNGSVMEYDIKQVVFCK